MDRKKRLFNKVLIVSGTSAVLLFAGYLFFTHRAAHHYFIPKGYSGWVTIKFEKPGAAALPEKDGAVEFHIPPSGILETSSKLVTGWARDEFFWETANGKEPIPKQVDCPEGNCRWVHDLKENNMSYEPAVLGLPDVSDTLLWDGARISKKNESVQVRPGRKTMVHFWVSTEPMPFFYHHDSLPPVLAKW